MRGVSNSNLPPSVEGAYYKKSIEIKRRIDEIEANNDKKRVSLERVKRDVQKLRLERALLINMIQQAMQPRPEESEKSSSPPPTVSVRVLLSYSTISFGFDSVMGVFLLLILEI
jgi:hypothetical protein